MGRLGPKCSSCLFHRVRRAAWGEGRQHPSPGPLQVPHRVTGPQPHEGALDLYSCSSQRPCLSLHIIAFLPPWGDRAGLSLRQATQSLTTGIEGSPRALSTRQRTRRQLPRAAAQRQAACGRLAGNSGRLPLYLPSSLGLVLMKNWNLPNCPKAWSWDRQSSLPSPGLGTKVRAGQDPGGRATGSAEGILAEG